MRGVAIAIDLIASAALSGALIIRSFDADTPFLGFLLISALRRRALAASVRLHDALVAVTRERAVPLLVGALAVSLALKLIPRRRSSWLLDG